MVREILSRQVRLALCLFAATLTSYLPALNGEFLWDDSGHVTYPALRSLEGLGRIWTHLGTTQQYYPLLYSAFWIEHRLWGDNVVGYHLLNVLLHATSAFLVVLVVRKLRVSGAVLAGFVFALHPVCVEAVAWISEQKSTLSGCLYLGAALLYLQFDETRRRSRYALALSLFLLALLSKTVTATLPAALLITIWWRNGRLAWKRDVRPLAAWFPLAAAAGVFTAWVERKYVGAEGLDYTLTVPQHILLASRAICFYAWKFALPVNLTFSYPRWTIDSREWWQYLFPAAVIACLATLALLARRNPGPLAGVLFFIATLFPVLGFVNVYPFRFSWVADHFQYLACLGLIIPLCSALVVVATRNPYTRSHTSYFGAAVCIVLGVLTWRQCGMYSDPETLFSETIARNPGSFMAHVNLGNIFVDIPERLPDAIAEYEAARRIDPSSMEAHNDLAVALERSGRLRDAIPEYATAVRLRPDFVRARMNLGRALLELPDRRQDAIAEFQIVLRLQPDYQPAKDMLRELGADTR
jgi:hypothetical protein